MDVFELVDAVVRTQRRERWFAPEVPPAPSGEGTDGGGAEQDLPRP